MPILATQLEFGSPNRICGGQGTEDNPLFCSMSARYLVRYDAMLRSERFKVSG